MIKLPSWRTGVAMPVSRGIIAACAVSATLVLAGCGGKSASASKVPAGRSVTAHATDFKYSSPLPATIQTGAVHVVLVNDSKTYQHELWIYPQQQGKLQDLLAQKAAGQDVNEEDFLQGVAGKLEDVDPGKTATFDANLAPGTYEYACFITSDIGGKHTVHYTLGMQGTFTVP
jgi:uncharacterized cupredoxin-like copper-binding protein